MVDSHLVTSAIDIGALLYLTVLVRDNNMMLTHRRKSFLYGILLTILVILAEAGTLLVGNEDADYRILHMVFNVLGFALTPVIPIALTAIYSIRVFRTHPYLLVPTGINFAAAVLSPFFGLLFTIDEGNHYARGNLFFVFVVVYMINILLLVVSTLRIDQKNRDLIKWKIAGLSLATVFISFIQVLFPAIHSSWHCVTLSLFLFFIILSDFDGSFDTLTGLFNRAAFDKASARVNENRTGSVVILDVNDFKGINDKYGHDYGDTILKMVASVIRESFDDQCCFYRIGGDEFIVICKDTDADGLERHLKRMTDNLTMERRQDIHLPTVAYGYGIFPGGRETDFKKTFREADEQMYYFKQKQKGRDYRPPKPGP